MDQPKIVVIDTDRVRAREMVAVLRENEFRAIACLSPLKALSFIRKEHPDAVVLEVIMPKRSGFEIAARLQADPRLCRLPLIFISDIQNTTNGNHDYFPRPLDLEKLVATLRNRISSER
jgi:DNA-binding response OmpR family regulator